MGETTRMVRVLVTADTAQALAKMEEVAAVSDEAAVESDSALGGAAASTGNMFERLGAKLEGWGIPFGSSVSKMGENLSEAETKGQKFGSALQSVGKVALIGLAAAAAGAAAESMKMADEFDKASNSIAANAGISQRAAKGIADSFLDAAGGTLYSGTQVAQAYAGVAAQLASVQGHALNAAQATGVMRQAMLLSEATGGDLNGTTAALAKTMQAFGVSSSGAADAANVLFTSARVMGTDVGSVAQQFQRLHSQLGVMTPPLGQVGALLEDMATHGESGRQGLSAASSGLNTMLTASEGVIKAQQLQQAIFAQMSPSLRALVDRYKEGDISQKTFTTDTQALGQQQQVLASQWNSAGTAVQTAQNKLAVMGITVDNAQGQFVGMASVIGQLHDKIQGMTQAQALATLSQSLGSTAASKMLLTIEAGPAAYEKAVAAMNHHNATAEAAQKATANLDDQFKIIGKDVEDLGIKVGEVLLPPFETAVGFLTGHLWIFAALAAVIGGALVIAIGAYTVSLATAAVAQIAATWEIMLIVAGVALLVAGILLLVTHWRQAWGDVTSVVSGVWGWIDGRLVQPMLNFFEGLPGNVKNAFSTLATAITSPFRSAFDFVAQLWNNTLGKLSFSIPGWVPMIGGDKFSLPQIPLMATGGVVTGNGLAYLHAGEIVVNPQQQQAAAASGAINITVNAPSNRPQDIVDALRLYVLQRGHLPFQL